MAILLHKTVGELKEKMTIGELKQWYAYFRSHSITEPLIKIRKNQKAEQMELYKTFELMASIEKQRK